MQVPGLSEPVKYGSDHTRCGIPARVAPGRKPGPGSVHSFASVQLRPGERRVNLHGLVQDAPRFCPSCPVGLSVMTSLPFERALQQVVITVHR